MGGFTRQRLPDEAPEPTGPQVCGGAPDLQQTHGNAWMQQNIRPAAPAMTCEPGQESAENAERGRQEQVRQADQRLATLQRSSAESFGRDINDPRHGHPGVTEDGRDDRGPQVDAWNREAGVSPGSMWCGTSVGHHYNQGTGGGFQDQLRVASDNRARNYFLYHQDHTEAPRGGESPEARQRRLAHNAELDRNEAATQQQQAAEGSTRRYMTYRPDQRERGPTATGGRPEVYNDPAHMPVRSGDTVVFSHRWRPDGQRDTNHGHIAMVESGPDERGNVTIVEGNAGGTPGHNQVQRRTVNVASPEIDGFGRPALGDMTRGQR